MTNSAPPLCPGIADIKALIQQQARRVTSYDVAILAGVSQSAVSRCFKPGASVSKSTYARVMKAAQELDYIPNAAARSLMTRRSNLVAVVAPETSVNQYPHVLTELSRQFGERGMRVVLFVLPHERELDAVLADVWQHQVDGAIVAARLSPMQVAEFERRRVPLVLFNRALPNRPMSVVECDQRAAARLLTTRLAAAGHKRFAVLDGPEDASTAQARIFGIRERLAELGLPAPLLVTVNGDYDSGARGLRSAIDQLGGMIPDAVICGSDLCAIGVLDSARHELKISVPEQMSVTGFGGTGPASWLCYNLTTLRQPVQHMAGASAEMLTGLIKGSVLCPERRVFNATIVEGATARLGPES
jgi:DNA-binding LacI/PurR family transcriptional regulator